MLLLLVELFERRQRGDASAERQLGQRRFHATAAERGERLQLQLVDGVRLQVPELEVAQRFGNNGLALGNGSDGG